MPSRLEILEAQLPLLPGNTAKKELENYRKSHALDFVGGVSIVRENTPGIGCVPKQTVALSSKEHVLTSADVIQQANNTTNKNGEIMPSWIAFEKQVLRFYGYYREEAPETKVDMKNEPYRIRKVMVYFYLEDDSAQVVEPKVENSGLAQGNLIRRHRIPLPGATNQHHTLIHFNVGKALQLYAKTFYLTSCDGSTRKFLESLNIHVPPDQQNPEDPFEVNVLKKPSRPKVSPHTLGTDSRPSQGLKKFLEQDGHLLRFFCIWDDLDSPKGTLHRMIILYYLADDTMEIREIVQKGTTAEGTAPFIRRHRVPRKTLPLTMDGSALGPPPPGTNQFYSEQDFKIGSIIQIYGRPFVICDMDGRTRQYYSEVHPSLVHQQPISFEEFSRIDSNTGKVVLKPKVNDEKRHAHGTNANTAPVPAIGALAGIGARPKITRKRGVDDVIFRFSARMVSEIEVDRDRSFVFTFYYADETLMIFENVTKNIGLPGGKFLERSRVLKPDDVKYLAPSDLKEGTEYLILGAKISVYGRIFQLIQADKYTKEYMAKHPEIFIAHD